MKNFLLIVMMSIYIFAATMNQKMIISACKDSSEAKQVLLAVKLFIDEQKQFPPLDTKIEKLDEYFLVTISPIDSIPLKHALHSALQTKFSGIFIIENIVLESEENKRSQNTSVKLTVEPKTPKIIPKSKTIIRINKKDENNEKRSFLQDIDSEWYALLALALAGLMLIIRSNNQIGKIKKLQMELEEIQKKNDK